MAARVCLLLLVSIMAQYCCAAGAVGGPNPLLQAAEAAAVLDMLHKLSQAHAAQPVQTASVPPPVAQPPNPMAGVVNSMVANAVKAKIAEALHNFSLAHPIPAPPTMTGTNAVVSDAVKDKIQEALRAFILAHQQTTTTTAAPKPGLIEGIAEKVPVVGNVVGGLLKPVDKVVKGIPLVGGLLGAIL